MQETAAKSKNGPNPQEVPEVMTPEEFDDPAKNPLLSKADEGPAVRMVAMGGAGERWYEPIRLLNIEIYSQSD
jgi:hypothetical protein